jgi:hypothetical protein
MIRSPGPVNYLMSMTEPRHDLRLYLCRRHEGALTLNAGADASIDERAPARRLHPAAALPRAARSAQPHEDAQPRCLCVGLLGVATGGKQCRPQQLRAMSSGTFVARDSRPARRFLMSDGVARRLRRAVPPPTGTTPSISSRKCNYPAEFVEAALSVARAQVFEINATRGARAAGGGAAASCASWKSCATKPSFPTGSKATPIRPGASIGWPCGGVGRLRPQSRGAWTSRTAAAAVRRQRS